MYFHNGTDKNGRKQLKTDKIGKYRAKMAIESLWITLWISRQKVVQKRKRTELKCVSGTLTRSRGKNGFPNFDKKRFLRMAMRGLFGKIRLS